ncbi:DUF4345 domain-containing protein [Erythrobacter sp. Alg231-14]|uniref:DUF4345 domain-containing protein n=1 Tax=Erythrobacter sp. Alg231-14 TaxID=1922225 RepID=UPI00307BCAA7
MTNFGTRIVLAATGAILIGIGSWIMAAPTIILATSEVIVEHDAGLMSEVTAPSGMLVIVGAFMIVSAIKAHLASLGLAAGTVVYGSYGFSRMVSQYLHGAPSDSLVVVMYFELAVAALLLALTLKIQAANPLQRLDAFPHEMAQ